MSPHVSRGLSRARWREYVVLAGLAGTLVLMFVLSVATGSTWIPLGEVLAALAEDGAGADGTAAIVHSIRLPRALTALLAGAGLGIAGLQMQTLFRNPLVDPFALGISAGASLGVAFVVLGGGYGTAALFGESLGLAGDAVVTVAAAIGALLVMALVLAVSSQVADATTVLILGLMFGYTVSALVVIIIGASQPERLVQWAEWQAGSFSGVTWNRLGIFVPVIVAGLAIAAASTKQLNALLLGEHYARSMGLAVRRARLLTMFGASVLGAVVTAFCGPIAFLGIAVPHIGRALLGTSDHRVLVPAVMLAGASVALFAQVVAVAPSSGILPLNAVMAVVGAPIVVVVVLRNRRGVVV